jgi:FtsH-binding integral membrane protein
VQLWRLEFPHAPAAFRWRMMNRDYSNFSYIDGQTVESQLAERELMRSVFGWMFIGLLVTAAAALWVVTSPGVQQYVLGNRGAGMILFLVEIGLVINLSARITRMSPAAAAACFLIFSLLNGVSLSWIAFAYTGASIVQAFAVSGGMFGAMSLYGFATKRDLTSWGSFFFMGLIGIILLSLVNMFVRSAGLSFILGVVGVFVFVGLTAWDTQRIKSFARTSGAMRENLAIYGALALYLDFVNMFMMLLQLFGNRRR